VEALFDRLLAARPPSAPPIWRVGIGVPGPVELATGRPTAPPIMPGWDGYPVLVRFAAGHDVPARVDNDVDMMARGERDLVYIKIGTGIGTDQRFRRSGIVFRRSWWATPWTSASAPRAERRGSVFRAR
jgi:predicted NBD/HSP70 family sugar kinase